MMETVTDMVMIEVVKIVTADVVVVEMTVTGVDSGSGEGRVGVKVIVVRQSHGGDEVVAEVVMTAVVQSVAVEMVEWK